MLSSSYITRKFQVKKGKFLIYKKILKTYTTNYIYKTIGCLRFAQVMTVGFSLPVNSSNFEIDKAKSISSKTNIL